MNMLQNSDIRVLVFSSTPKKRGRLKDERYRKREQISHFLTPPVKIRRRMARSLGH